MHDDLEIAVRDRQFRAVRHELDELEWFVVGDGLAHTVDERSLARHHQTWGWDAAAGRWRLDVMREPWDGDTWVCRRDPRLRRRRSELIAVSSDGIPYAQPEIVLLFKAKALREKDQADFEAVLPHLDSERRGSLSEALELVHPGHRWLEALGAA